jgi:hypothetical protein
MGCMGRVFLGVVGFLFYPCKERCFLCLERIDKKLNPYKDPGFVEV